MILSLAVVLGLTIAIVRYRRQAFSRIASIPLRYPWVILIAIILQIPLLRAPAVLPGQIRIQQALLLISYMLLLLFFWLNRHLAAVWLIAAGILANLVVILLNGGLMPVTPQTLVKINPGSTVDEWQTGLHYLGSKDVVQTADRTRAGFLSDRFTVKPPFPLPFAFSLGDIFIAAGIVWLLGNLPPATMNGNEMLTL